MTVPVQSLVVGELTTGRRLVVLPFLGGRWSVAAGGAGTIEATIPLRAAEFRQMLQSTIEGVTRWTPGTKPRKDIRGLTEPTRMFAAALAGDRVIEAGPVWVREWDDDAGTLTLRAAGIRSVLDHRLLVSHLVDWLSPGGIARSELAWSGLSLGTIATRMVAETLAHVGGMLPIILPDDEPGTTERTFPGFDLGMVGDRLTQLSEVINGPEIAFEPRLTADRMGMEWLMRVGTTVDPTLHQAGADWQLDASVPRGDLGRLRVVEDASSVGVRALAKGSGTDEATLISRVAIRADLLEAKYPLLDSVRTHSSVLRQATIDAHAEADLASNDRPLETWKTTILADARLGHYRPGDWWSIRIGRDHVYLPRGVYRARLAAASGDLGGTTVALDMEPQEVPG